jgi:catechol 2,3-dioxygenase-like lactoylglutathione lyase family enzyme
MYFTKFSRERICMADEVTPLVFSGGQSNYYASDVDALVAFYRQQFGFRESYRTPPTGPAEHVELRLGDYLIALSSQEAARRIHHLPIDPGKPRGEIVLWTNDVDGAHQRLMADQVHCIREPHNFDVNETLKLRVAWYEDPEGNIFQTVCQR